MSLEQLKEMQLKSGCGFLEQCILHASEYSNIVEHKTYVFHFYNLLIKFHITTYMHVTF